MVERKRKPSSSDDEQQSVSSSPFIARNMDRWVGKIAVVTGASSGIGAAIAEALVKEGIIVVGVARRLDNLKALSASLKGAKGKLYAKQCDVTKEDELLGTFEWVNTELGGIDILVNNAGVWSTNRVIDGNIKEFRKLLDLNVLASAVSLQEAVASMQRRNVAGHIININSVAGHWLPGQASSLYPATKHAITTITETVRRELSLANSKIKITSVSPGFVKTDIMRASGVANHEQFFDNLPHLQPKSVVDAVLYILGTPEDVQVMELTLCPVGEKAF
nr:farnesol dehydrogenase-like isoform X2 [Neodiprion pinetum]